jgi:hypothetical protein
LSEGEEEEEMLSNGSKLHALALPRADSRDCTGKNREMQHYSFRRLTDRIVDHRDPEYCIISMIGSGSHFYFEFARNYCNGDPWEGYGHFR